MGVFDLFGKDRRTGNDRNGEGAFGRNGSDSSRTAFAEGNLRGEYRPNGSENYAEEKNNPVSVFMPASYEEVEKIIDALKLGKTAVVHLTELKTETALRILDMLSGAIYALGGGVYEMQKNIFMFSPCGVEVHEG